MTNEQVRDGFNEVHNEFWNRYKNHVPDKDSDEWEKIKIWRIDITKKYPFLAETVRKLEVELDQRPMIEMMDLVDVKIYRGLDGVVMEVLLKYVPGQADEKAVCEKRPHMLRDEDKIWS